jgi:hypothetical protein
VAVAVEAVPVLCGSGGLAGGDCLPVDVDRVEFVEEGIGFACGSEPGDEVAGGVEQGAVQPPSVALVVGRREGVGQFEGWCCMLRVVGFGVLFQGSGGELAGDPAQS